MIKTCFVTGALLATVIAVAATPVHPAQAADAGGRLTHLSGTALLRMCQAGKPALDQVCKAYISGISDGITLVESAAGPNSARDVCTPAGVSGDQLRSVVVGWMSKHPDRLAADVGPIVYDAMKSDFPCGAGTKP